MAVDDLYVAEKTAECTVESVAGSVADDVYYWPGDEYGVTSCVSYYYYCYYSW